MGFSYGPFPQDIPPMPMGLRDVARYFRLAPHLVLSFNSKGRDLAESENSSLQFYKYLMAARDQRVLLPGSYSSDLAGVEILNHNWLRGERTRQSRIYIPSAPNNDNSLGVYSEQGFSRTGRPLSSYVDLGFSTAVPSPLAVLDNYQYHYRFQFRFMFP
jgi:hypothetical protein